MIQLRRILVPTDFSTFSDQAVRYGCEIANRFSADLHLLHVAQDAFPVMPEAGLLTVSHADYMARVVETAHKLLAGVPAAGMLQKPVAARDVVLGVPFVEIIRYARDKQIDLIVMPTHGRTGLVHMLLGSVAEKVIRKAPCPVLTIRPEGHDYVHP
jgi:nucleotide-binding universal stress UspA family protein